MTGYAWPIDLCEPKRVGGLTWVAERISWDQFPNLSDDMDYITVEITDIDPEYKDFKEPICQIVFSAGPGVTWEKRITVHSMNGNNYYRYDGSGNLDRKSVV